MGSRDPVIGRGAVRLLLSCALVPLAARADEPPAPTATLAPVSVVGVTPLPGLDLPRDRVPATGFDGSGCCIAQPFAPDAEGRLPMGSSTFYAPGATRLVSLSIRYAFD